MVIDQPTQKLLTDTRTETKQQTLGPSLDAVFLQLLDLDSIEKKTSASA